MRRAMAFVFSDGGRLVRLIAPLQLVVLPCFHSYDKAPRLTSLPPMPWSPLTSCHNGLAISVSQPKVLDARTAYGGVWSRTRLP